MRDFARSLYKSKQWERVRELVIQRSKGLCERCLRMGKVTPGKIVHHKIPLTPDNVDDPSISLNPDLLEYLCKECHEIVHALLGEGVFQNRQSQPRVAFDSLGNVVGLEGG